MPPEDRSIQNRAENLVGQTTQKRIVIATWGSLGDLHPYLAIAVELKRRGHQVLVASNALHQAKVEALGFEFSPLGPAVPEDAAGRRIIEQAMHPWNGPQWLFKEFLDPYARTAYAELDAACESADFLLAHGTVLSAPIVARKRGLRWASGVLAPVLLWSRHDPPHAALPFGLHTPTSSLGKQLWSRISKPLAQTATRPWFRQLDALRAENGLSTQPHPLFEMMFSVPTLALFSRELGLPQSDWPTEYLQCGVPILQQQVLEGAWKSWLEAGSPPIVWTLGSTAVHVAHDFWRHAFHAARQMHLSHGLRSLFLVGDGDYWRLPAPSHTWGLVTDYAPFEDVFSRARLVVHQGGVGTTQAAMRAGTPQLIVPWSQDQPDNADRIVARGLGLSLHRASFDSQSAITSMSALIDAPKYLQRAKTVAASMRANEPNPAACAADAIEAQLAADSHFGNIN